ncbi:MAG: hypothetical protein IJ764_06255 [Bacteroidales bacterium]|nr:hypothetical protein [Bacteroidales bacterium]
MPAIPKENSPAAIVQRRNLLRQALEKHIGQQYRNKHLSMAVTCTKASVKEIAHHAAKSEASTRAALRLKSIVQNANVLYIDLPKGGNQSKKFNAWITIVMQYGNTKLTLCDTLKHSQSGQSNMVLYCITHEK